MGRAVVVSIILVCFLFTFFLIFVWIYCVLVTNAESCGHYNHSFLLKKVHFKVDNAIALRALESIRHDSHDSPRSKLQPVHRLY